MALKLDNNLLEELGLGALPEHEKQLLLRQIYEKLEMNVGVRLADQMSNEQLDEFEKFVDSNDDKGAFQWLESNFPNYKDVVNQEFEKLKAEIKQYAPQMLAVAQQNAAQQAAMPGAGAMPGAAPHATTMPGAMPGAVGTPPQAGPAQMGQPAGPSPYAAPPQFNQAAQPIQQPQQFQTPPPAGAGMGYPQPQPGVQPQFGPPPPGYPQSQPQPGPQPHPGQFQGYPGQQPPAGPMPQ